MNKKQKHVVLRVTFGNILEWFEIYSYAYLAPIISKLFFNFDSNLSNLISAFVLFGSGFLTRPFGAIIFGRIGDLLGRKKAFLWSILVMTIPTFLMGCLPTYAQLGIYAPALLAILRLMQSIPAAGEAPGTFCFLYENADPGNKIYMTSWGAFGNQIGAIVGVLETFLMDQFMTEEFLMAWGWRISFWSGGIIGLLGIFLRKKLYETPVFNKIKEEHKIDKETTLELIKNQKSRIFLGASFCFINASTFFLIATYVPAYFGEKIGLSSSVNSIISLSILFLLTILLPIFGKIGDKFNNKTILICCSALIISLLYPMYKAINSDNFIMMAIISFFYIIPIACMAALLVYQITHLFSPSIRYTGVGLAFNLADGIVGGFTPAISLLLLEYTHNQGAFCWFILICAIASLAAYSKIKR